MRKIGIKILLLTLLVLTGCGEKTVDNSAGFHIYYINSAMTKVVAEDYVLEGTDDNAQLEEVLSCLSVVPENQALKAPLAMGFSIQKQKLRDGKLKLDMDEHYRELSDISEILVRGAIVKTLTQLEGVSFVEFTVNGTQLFDNAGELVGWMSADQFIQNDGNEINTIELTKVMLYFANEAGDGLIGAYREKRYSTNTPLERFIVEELIAGPSGQIEGLYPTINPATKIINVLTKDGICYVNLDENFLTACGNVSVETAIYSIVNSLVELNNINKVQILVNGEIPDTFSNTIYDRNLDIVTTL